MPSTPNLSNLGQLALEERRTYRAWVAIAGHEGEEIEREASARCDAWCTASVALHRALDAVLEAEGAPALPPELVAEGL